MTASRFALAAALLALAPLARAQHFDSQVRDRLPLQDRPGPGLLRLSTQEGEKKGVLPCDIAAQEDSLWCGKCKKLREKEQVADGKCKECQTVPEPLKVCVKKWIPRCGMHEQKPHLEGCCKSKFCCKIETLKSPLVFKCRGCGESSRTEAGVAHKGIEHDKKLVRCCEASGTQPHGGEPLK